MSLPKSMVTSSKQLVALTSLAWLFLLNQLGDLTKRRNHAKPTKNGSLKGWEHSKKNMFQRLAAFNINNANTNTKRSVPRCSDFFRSVLGINAEDNSSAQLEFKHPTYGHGDPTGLLGVENLTPFSGIEVWLYHIYYHIMMGIYDRNMIGFGYYTFFWTYLIMKSWEVSQLTLSGGA